MKEKMLKVKDWSQSKLTKIGGTLAAVGLTTLGSAYAIDVPDYSAYTTQADSHASAATVAIVGIGGVVIGAALAVMGLKFAIKFVKSQ